MRSQHNALRVWLPEPFAQKVVLRVDDLDWDAVQNMNPYLEITVVDHQTGYAHRIETWWVWNATDNAWRNCGLRLAAR